jgi:hypothetical protein
VRRVGGCRDLRGPARPRLGTVYVLYPLEFSDHLRAIIADQRKPPPANPTTSPPIEAATSILYCKFIHPQNTRRIISLSANQSKPHDRHKDNSSPSSRRYATLASVGGGLISSALIPVDAENAPTISARSPLQAPAFGLTNTLPHSIVTGPVAGS